MFEKLKYKHNAVKIQKYLDKYDEFDNRKFFYKAIATNAKNEFLLKKVSSPKNTTFNTHFKFGK